MRPFAGRRKLSYQGLSLSFFNGDDVRRLPFLNGVRAFEAAARTGSFARAADELHVSPAAISRLVHLLEERIGAALFERKANRLAPTAAGRAYQAGLTPLFDTLANLTAQVSAMAGARVLTVGVGPTFAVRWLIPRLAEFQKVAPEVEVRFATGGMAAPFSDDWTCGITLGDGDWPGLVSERLFAADLTPVCAPALARRLKQPDDLRAATLLRVTHARDDWPRWIRAAGLAKVSAKGPEFEYYGQALQAALDGVGVAMGISPYIDDDVKAGRLVAPFRMSVPKGMHWYLVYREARSHEPSFATFRKWIAEAAG
jgi:LysR family transcriptional regulator, glycine cleavage system transcriptional activator